MKTKIEPVTACTESLLNYSTNKALPIINVSPGTNLAIHSIPDRPVYKLDYLILIYENLDNKAPVFRCSITLITAALSKAASTLADAYRNVDGSDKIMKSGFHSLNLIKVID